MDTEHEELLLGRIVDAEESTGEWAAFSLEADRSPRLWRELAIQQREARLLESALRRRVEASGVEAIAAPRTGALRLAGLGTSPPPGDRSQGHLAGHSGGRPGGVPWRWSGWALAACLLGAWIVSASLPGSNAARNGSRPAGADRDGPGRGDVSTASLLSPEQAFQAYLDRGREEGTVVGEVRGRPVIERRPLANGEGFELLVVRQVVERRRVPALYDFAQEDERGVPLATPIEPRRGGSL